MRKNVKIRVFGNRAAAGLYFNGEQSTIATATGETGNDAVEKLAAKLALMLLDAAAVKAA